MNLITLFHVEQICFERVVMVVVVIDVETKECVKRASLIF